MTKAALLILYGVLIGLLAAGLILLVGQQPRGRAIILLPTGQPAPLVVEVGGAVANPGVYHLAQGSRVQQAVEAAGGLRSDASQDSVNLAQRIQDGMKLTIPRAGMEGANPTVQPLLSGGEAEAVDEIINVNSATPDLLEKLPGIGPVKAKQICDYRQEHGLFDKIEDLLAVPGIGPATFELIKTRITV